jgi:DNA-binding response OmpR family regulator
VKGYKVLVVDDDADLVRLLTRSFAKAGARVYNAYDGRSGLRAFFAHRPDLVILDVRMPVMDGWQTCARIRNFSDVPIIFLTVAGATEDVVRGLDLGAVDYVTKPFSVSVLLARAQAALRRATPSSTDQTSAVYDDGYLRIDLLQHEILAGGEWLELSNTEYRLLAYLVQRAGRVVSTQEILEAVWGPEYRDNARYVHIYIWRLRQKLEEDPKHPRYVVTRRGVGYSFEKRALQQKAENSASASHPSIVVASQQS